MQSQPMMSYKKRATVISKLDVVSEHAEVSVGSQKSRQVKRDAIYKKATVSELKSEPTLSVANESVISEKSYDSESDIDLTQIEELEKLEEEKRQSQLEDAKLEKQTEEFRKAGVGKNFLDELLNENYRDSVVEEEKKIVEEEDMIQLVDESEHLFIRYAQ